MYVVCKKRYCTGLVQYATLPNCR